MEYMINIAEGFVSPTDITVDDNNNNTLYIADQIGIIYRLDTYSNILVEWLNITSKIGNLDKSYDEKGILGITFNPKKDRVYLFYSTKDNIDILSEIPILNDIPVINEEKIILRMEKDFPYHHGGKINFGPDGYLYVGLGDGDEQEDPQNNAQNLAIPFGKILRLDVDSNSNYYPNRNAIPLCIGTCPRYHEERNHHVPIDNPYNNTIGALPEIYAVGFRNPWSLSWNKNEQLVVADVGYKTGTGSEEINIVIKGGNYGWPYFEGNKQASFRKNVPQIPNIKPVFDYTTGDFNFSRIKPGSDKSSSAIIGGGFIYDDYYIFADLSGIITVLKTDDYEWSVYSQLNINENANEQTWQWIKSMKVLSNKIPNNKILNNKIYVLTSNNIGPEGNTGKVFILNI